MRERITFVHSPDVGVDPETLKIESNSLRAPNVEAAREDRLTIALDGLPTELAQVLPDFQELHLRWSSPAAYATLAPFASRLSPGLHITYTPHKGNSYEPYDTSSSSQGSAVNLCDRARLCSFLQILGPLDCSSDDSFTVTKDRHASGEVTSYFYQPLETLQKLADSLKTEFCHGDEACKKRAQSLESAVAFDFTFDSDTNVAKITALWPLEDRPVSIDTSSKWRTEVGILAQSSPPNLGDHEIGMGGTLTILGERKKPSPTLFSFPSRHRLSRAHFSSRFVEPTGLHPALQITLSDNQTPVKDGECQPYAYLTLPKTIFADRYQLDDELFLASKNLTASRYTSLPVDLEAPAYKTETWGSNLLLELAPPPASEPQEWTAQVPLHLRYLQPSATGERAIEIPYPVVFWACETDEDVDFANNPFDRQKLGFDSLFSSNTAFWYAAPRPVEGDRLVSTLHVPVLKDESASWVGLGTAAVIALGFAWVFGKIVSSYLSQGHSSTSGKDDKTVEEKKPR